MKELLSIDAEEFFSSTKEFFVSNQLQIESSVGNSHSNITFNNGYCNSNSHSNSAIDNQEQSHSCSYSNSNSYSCYANTKTKTAICYDKLLVITDNNTNCYEVLCEVDFENELVVVAWDTNSQCVVVGDTAGQLHLLTDTGTVLFTRKIIQDSQDAQFSSLQFLNGKDNKSQTLVAVVNNGTVFTVSNFLVSTLYTAVSDDPDTLPSILKCMRFGKSSIQGCTPLKKTIVLTITPSVVNSYIDSDSYSNCDSDSAAATTINDTVMGSVKLIVVYLDSQKQLYQADLGTITDIVPVANTAQLLLDNSNCVDINCATDTTTKAFGVITRENNSVVVYDFVNGAIVGYFGNYNRVITQCHIHSFNDIYTKLIIGSVLKNIDNNHEYNLKFVLISHNATGPIHSVLELGTRTLLSNTILRNSSGASCNSEIKVHILDNNMYITQINSQLLKLNIAIGIDAEEQKLTIDEQIALSLLKTMTVPADLETRQNTLKDCVYKLKEITQLSKVVSLLPLFFLISTPFAGYLAELLTIVKEIVTKSRVSESKKSKYLSTIQSYRRCLDTARVLTGINATESELSITMHSLLPKNVLRTLQSMITLNNLKKAGIVVSKQVWSKFPLPLDTLIPSIPPETYASDVVEWINTIVLPRITIAELNSYALLLSQQLSKRAIDLEMSSNRLKECLQLVDLSIKLTNSVSITQSQTIYTFVNELKSLQSKFRLLLLLWKEWHQRFSLEDIDSVGLEGLIFDRIDETAETKIVNDVLTNIKPITITENIDLDQLLAKWIEESVRTRIICVKKSITDDDEVCTLSRLLQVLTIITNNTVKAKMILLLFQVSSLDNSESNDLISYLQTENIRRLQEESDVNEEKTRIASVLLQLACSVQEQVDVGYREALTEAIKLLKIRSIASKYNIDSFDSRNVHQLRAALSIIASNQSESAITDAISFAEDWNSDKVDLPSVITNAIIQRIYALNYTMQEGLSSDEIRIRTIFSFIPQNKLHIVIEDCLSYLLETINDNCQLLVDHNTENNDSYCDNLRREIINLTRGAILIVNVSIDSKSNVDNTSDSEGAGRFDSWIDSKILSDLKRLHVLQTEYKVFISTNELLSKDICEKVVENLAKKRVMLLLTDVPTDTNKESWSTTTVITSYYRKACILLNLTAVHFLHVCIGLFTDKGFLAMARYTAELLAKEMADALGETGLKLDGDGPSDAAIGLEEYDLATDAAVKMCTLGAKSALMKKPRSDDDDDDDEDDVASDILSFPVAAFDVARTILNFSIISCPASGLNKMINLVSTSDLVLSIFGRVEGSPTTGQVSASTELKSSQLLKIADGTFARDGILMHPKTIIGPLIQFALGEMKRRNSYFGSSSDVDKAGDITQLSNVLQRAENHLLSNRVLLSTWSSDSQKAQVLKSSLLALGRKILLYRDIDVSYAVACLAALPHDQMVRELKSSLPSIQSDFSRLQVVAQIGEELSRLWSDENLLLVFQNLQTNSKWWNILSSHGVKVEARSFQNPNLKERETFIRAVIPELLERSHMNLEMVVEYSRQFNLSPEVAVLTYVEHLLSHSSESMSYQEWISCFHKAICGVEEKAVASCIRNSMHKIHPLHYEKIRYACGWIIDYLLAEEDPNSNDCDDDIENNPSVQNKRLSIGSTESGKKVSSASRISLEVASYRKYVDIVDYLVTMKLPSDVISAIPYIGSFYSHSTSSYKDRLPLWQLLEDPWAVFDPLLTFVPEIAAKLSPLCSHLQIDLSDFNARRLMALYNRPVLAEQSVSHSNIEKTKLTSFANILSEMKAITLAPIQQVELLRWIFEKERRDTTQVAVEALNHALFILEAPSTMEAIRDDYIAQESATMMQQELYSELMKLKCEQTIKKFNSYLAENNRIASKLVSLVGEPTVLVKAILEISLELAWDIHIRNFSCDPYVNAMSMSNLPVTHELTKFVETVSLTLNETVAHCSDEENLKATVADSVKVARSKLLGKLLSDVERNSTNNADTRSHGNNWNTPTDFWSSSQETHLMPTASEARRREDLFLGFSAYVTIASCSNSDERSELINQLDLLMRGQGPKGMLRMTARSRYRAALASKLLNTSSDDTTIQNINSYKSFFCCFSEMQEIRLPCMEESLLYAFGYQKIDGNLQFVDDKTTDRVSTVISLVRTWLLDEGTYCETAELCRDLLLCCNLSDVAIWEELLQHMLKENQKRSLILTLVMITNSTIYSTLLTSCNEEFLSHLYNTVIEVHYNGSSKVNQIIEIARQRDADRTAFDWLSVESLDTTDQTAAVVDAIATLDRSQVLSESFLSRNDNNKHIGNKTNNYKDKVHKKIFLRTKLSYEIGLWEESPEDIMLILLQTSFLVSTLIPVLPANCISTNKLLESMRTLITISITYDYDYTGRNSAGTNRTTSCANRKVYNYLVQQSYFSIVNLLDNTNVVELLQSNTRKKFLVEIFLELAQSISTSTSNVNSSSSKIYNYGLIIWWRLFNAIVNIENESVIADLLNKMGMFTIEQKSYLLKAMLIAWNQDKFYVAVAHHFIEWCWIRLCYEPADNTVVEAIKVLTSQEFKTLHEIIGEVLSQGYKFRSVDSEETISDMNVIRQKLFSVLK